jgi:hypothetical protein
VIRAKKKGHGGLKFVAFVVAVAAMVGSVSAGRTTEVGQRIQGNREDRRLENTTPTPRFSYAAATLRISVGSIFNNDATMIDLTTTSDVSIDRQSETATSDIGVKPTATEIAPGVDALPYDNFRESWTEVLTRSYRFVSPDLDGDPWTRYEVEPYYYATEIDSHYIPMIDDIMGFELRDLPTKAVADEVASGFTAMKRPMVNPPKVPSAVTRSYSYDMDMTTYRRALPILATRTRLTAPPEAIVHVTIGFDDVGLMRFADISIADSVANVRAQTMGDGAEASYHYTLVVSDILGEPLDIDVPANVVDAAPAEIVPGT